MPILATPYAHFSQDIARAETIRHHANPLVASELRDDLMRAAWMMGVGALDAYFCDAYADLIARTLQAKQIQGSVQIPDKLGNLKVPVLAVIRPSTNENWRWRMTARELIEHHTVLSSDKIRQLFNQFFDDPDKLFGDTSFDDWLLHFDHKQRLFGISRATYRGSQGDARHVARKAAKKVFEKRYERIFKRRHDCIHNCDRPKIALDTSVVMSAVAIEKILYDIRFLVDRCHESLIAGYPQYLTRIGCNGVTRNRVCA